MNDPITFVDNKLITPCAELPAKMTGLFHDKCMFMLTVQYDNRHKSYRLPEDEQKLEDDIQALCAKHDALSFDTCEECRIAD